MEQNKIKQIIDIRNQLKLIACLIPVNQYDEQQKTAHRLNMDFVLGFSTLRFQKEHYHLKNTDFALFFYHEDLSLWWADLKKDTIEGNVVKFLEVLENSPPEIQEELVFNLNLFL